MAGLDANTRPEEYQQVLDALAPRYKEDRPRLADVVNMPLKVLRKNGADEKD
ncbi:MAG: hypothetical protein HOY79_37355 [Streptomyces sp.]|nr:hypothetical protein [Streptomyces sp.]